MLRQTSQFGTNWTVWYWLVVFVEYLTAVIQTHKLRGSLCYTPLFGFLLLGYLPFQEWSKLYSGEDCIGVKDELSDWMYVNRSWLSYFL
jgi:hypothetical protein